MIDFLRTLRAHPICARRLLGFIPALAITEMFYKFHSFSLECMTFLATWLLFDVLIEWIIGSVNAKVFSNRPDRLAASNRKNINR
jgi:hypothetical protein